MTQLELSVPELNQVVRALIEQKAHDEHQLAHAAAVRERLNALVGLNKIPALEAEECIGIALRDTERALRKVEDALYENAGTDRTADEWYEALWKDVIDSRWTESELRFADGDR